MLPYHDGDNSLNSTRREYRLVQETGVFTLAEQEFANCDRHADEHQASHCHKDHRAVALGDIGCHTLIPLADVCITHRLSVGHTEVCPLLKPARNRENPHDNPNGACPKEGIALFDRFLPAQGVSKQENSERNCQHSRQNFARQTKKVSTCLFHSALRRNVSLLIRFGFQNVASHSR